MSRKRDDSNCFDDEIFIALFRKGAHDYLEKDLCADMPINRNVADKYPSDVTDKKIRKMICKAVRREKNIKNMKRLPRIVAIVLIVLAVCSMTVMSVDALRVPFLNLFVNTEVKVSDIKFMEDQTSDKDGSFACLFGYVPEGYELTEENIREQGATFIYTNENGASLLINKFNTEGSVSLDTENAEYGEVWINGYEGFYSVKNDTTMLVFTKNEYAYLISGSADLDEIILIAENIK